MQRFPVVGEPKSYTGAGVYTLVALAAPVPEQPTETSIIVNDYTVDVDGVVDYRIYWDNAQETPLTPGICNKSVGGTIPNNWPGKDASGVDLGGDLVLEILSGTGAVRPQARYFKRIKLTNGSYRTTRRDNVNT